MKRAIQELVLWHQLHNIEPPEVIILKYKKTRDMGNAYSQMRLEYDQAYWTYDVIEGVKIKVERTDDPRAEPSSL